MAQGGATQLIFTVERIAVKLRQTKLNVHKTTFSKLIRRPVLADPCELSCHSGKELSGNRRGAQKVFDFTISRCQLKLLKQKSKSTNRSEFRSSFVDASIRLTARFEILSTVKP